VPVSRLAAAAGVTAPPLTQREAARRCGLHPTSLKAWEAGRTVPSARSRRRLEELYGLPDSALLAACPGA
jgi:transcriptional regulator with XRE-family HTH domain